MYRHSPSPVYCSLAEWTPASVWALLFQMLLLLEARFSLYIAFACIRSLSSSHCSPRDYEPHPWLQISLTCLWYLNLQFQFYRPYNYIQLCVLQELTTQHSLPIVSFSYSIYINLLLLNSLARCYSHIPLIVGLMRLQTEKTIPLKPGPNLKDKYIEVNRDIKLGGIHTTNNKVWNECCGPEVVCLTQCQNQGDSQPRIWVSREWL